MTVISDALVAAKYNIMLRRLGVSISPFKSWISSSGACEFAKRFVLEGRGVDLSPISAQMMNALTFSLATLCVVEKLKIELKSGRLCLRLHGAGYKVLSRLGHKRLNRQKLRFDLLLHRPGGVHLLPLRLAFPERAMLTCYSKGMGRWLLLERKKAREVNPKEVDDLEVRWGE